MKLILADKKELEVKTVTKQYITPSEDSDVPCRVVLDISLSSSCSEEVEELVEILMDNTNPIYLVSKYETTEFKDFTKLDSIYERYDSDVRQVNIRLSK